MSRLTGKIALVTGASKRIGAGIAKNLGAEGATVVDRKLQTGCDTTGRARVFFPVVHSERKHFKA